MDGVYKALADPTRRRILELLRAGDRTAGDLAGEFPMSWASVSHHLAILRRAELVVAERDGQHIVYSLNTTVLQEAVRHLIDLGDRKRKERKRA